MAWRPVLAFLDRFGGWKDVELFSGKRTADGFVCIVFNYLAINQSIFSFVIHSSSPDSINWIQ